MKKLFYILVLSVIGITSFNTYSKNIFSEAFAHDTLDYPDYSYIPDYMWACDSGEDTIWGAQAYFSSKEEAEKACSKYPNGKVFKKNVNAGMFKIG